MNFPRFSRLLIGAVTLSAITLSSPSQAFCGFFAGKADAQLFNEASQVILVRDGKRTVISMLNDYRGPMEDFALVVPVPQVLEKGQVHIGDKRIFERLDGYSAPRLAEYFDPDPCPMGPMYPRAEAMMDRMVMSAPAKARIAEKREDKALGVTVEAAYTVGEYDIVMLSAEQSNGLEIWLNQNGYKMPKGAAAALKPYVALDMKFFVAKVNLKAKQATGNQYLRPLQFAFESEKFMLPIRLGMINADPKKPQDLIAYVLTKNGRVESSNYRTVKLPANDNLPPAIKNDFKTFYKALFDHQAKQEDYRVVFTEYFWDMGWCDPCADNPLSRDELKQAGVFWASDTPVQQPMPGRPMPMVMPRMPGAQNAVISRLHVRYTPETFPEDLMFVQTSDRENWQSRYVIQNPYAGTLQQCQQKAAEFNCESACENNGFGDKASCVQSCKTSNSESLERARRYYQIDLPERRQKELQTLMRYTGWSAAQAQQFAGKDYDGQSSGGSDDKWWQTIFGSGK